MRFCCQNDGVPVFGTDKNTGKGYCKNHQYLRTDLDKRSIVQKAMDKNKVKRDFSKLKGLPENKDLVALKKWFDYVATVIKADPHCWNCGEFIPEQYYRHASAHIFPKSIFISVATHPFNFLVLGAGCGCHSEFDSSIDNACKMIVWNKAVIRFNSFEKLITETHKYLDLFKSRI